MEIIIAGDLVPTKSNFDLFNEGKIEELLGVELKKSWESADARIFNLEAPITNLNSPIKKNGPNLKVPVSTLKGIIALKPDLISLCNNHILDHGEKGLNSTIENLTNAGLNIVGVGSSLDEIKSHTFLTIKDKLIGVYSCTEKEFSIATHISAGANPYDPLETPDAIEKIKKQCDFLIVLYHGGKEHYRYPSPNLQKLCRKLVSKGADLVICQHSHCIGCLEKIDKSYIIYGQGNFIFDYSTNECWNTSILIKINPVTKEIGFIPIIRKKNAIELADKNQSDTILTSFFHRSEELKINGFIEKNYSEFANDRLYGYLTDFAGFNNLIKKLDRKICKRRIIKYLYSERKIISLLNYLECEAHHECIIRGMKNYYGEE